MHKCIPYEIFLQIPISQSSVIHANNLLQNISPYKKEDFL